MVVHQSIAYFHVNGIVIVQKIDFEIRPDLGCTTLKTSGKGFWTIRLCVCPSVCLTVAFPANSHASKG